MMPILLRMPIPILTKLDEAAKTLNMSRSDVIRRSLARDLEFIVAHEIERMKEHQRQTEAAYLRWADAEAILPVRSEA